MLLKNCRYVVTQNSRREILENVDILVEGNRISSIAKDLDGEDAIDCSERIVMPGLVNAHAHLGMTHLRGISDDDELAEWLERVWAQEREFTEEDILRGSYLGIVESLRSGTTAIADMYFREQLAGEAAQSLGARLIGFETLMDVHPLSRKTLDPPEDSGRVTYGLGPHSIYAADERLLKQVSDRAREKGLLVQVHLSETRKERAEFRARTGMLPAEYLDKIGFLSKSVLLVHCNWLTKGEIDRIAKSGASVVHCPRSNMKLAGGSVMPLKEMRERNITVCLGTDSAASNNSLDLFSEMRTAALLHKHHYWDPAILGAQETLDLATCNAASALRIEAGSLEEGRLADLITLDLEDVNLQPHDAQRVVSHLVYAACGLNVSEVIVDGKLLLKGKAFVKGSGYEPSS